MWKSVYVACGTLLFFVSDTYGADTCSDNLGSQCQDQAVQEVVCKDTASAPQFCAKTCGLCPTTKLSTVSTTPLMTAVTATSCVDASTQCSDINVLTVICQDKTTAFQLCAKSCGLCNAPSISSQTAKRLSTTTIAISTERLTTKPTSKSTVTTAHCYDDQTSHCDPKLSSFICADVHFSKFCRKMCGLCNSNTVTVDTQEVTTTVPPLIYKSTFSHAASHSGELQCTNAPDATCDEPTLLHIICQQLETALRFCAKSCGVCGKTLPSTKMTTPRYPTTTAIPTTTTSTCTDSTDITCTDPQVRDVVCSDSFTADKFCPKTCGRCVATTVDTCQDHPSGNCQDPDIKSIVCLDQETARKLCPKTCNVCNKQNIGAPVVG